MPTEHHVFFCLKIKKCVHRFKCKYKMNPNRCYMVCVANNCAMGHFGFVLCLCYIPWNALHTVAVPLTEICHRLQHWSFNQLAKHTSISNPSKTTTKTMLLVPLNVHLVLSLVHASKNVQLNFIHIWTLPDISALKQFLKLAEGPLRKIMT